MRFRRGVVLAAVLTAAGAVQVATAQAAPTASTTTTSGQTLTVTIDSPADGSDFVRYPGLAVEGTATVTGAPTGEAASVDRVDVEIDDRGWTDPVAPDGAGNWSYSTVYDGTHTYAATAVASDGSTATASIRFRAADETRVSAFPVSTVAPDGPGLHADLWLTGGRAASNFGGRTIQFFVAGLKVCEARTIQYGHFQGTATCANPAAMAAAAGAGGYTAVYPGDDDWLGSSDDGPVL